MKDVIEKVESWFVGTEQEYEKLEANYFGRENREKVVQQIKDNRKNFKYLAMGLVLIVLAITVKSLIGSDGLVYEDGKLVAIKVDHEAGATYDLEGNIDGENHDIQLDFYPSQKSDTAVIERNQDYYLNQMINEIEGSKDETVALPKELSTGESIIWDKGKDLSPVYIGLIMLLVLLLVRTGRYGKLRDFKKKSQMNVRCSLPSFINKLLIIWKSGATLDESIVQAALSTDRSGFFYENLRQIYERCSVNGQDYVMALDQFATTTQVREFKRITNIIIENRNKGSFLLDKLENERQGLWAKRKEQAIWEGKKAETKLVIPLTILLVSLVCVTGAPAFLQM